MDCDYVARKATKSRCTKWKNNAGTKAKDACGCACDEFFAPPPPPPTPRPTSAPTPAPTRSCFDDPGWRQAKKGKPKNSKGCEWLAKKGATKYRCKNYEDVDGVPAMDACGCVCSEFQ